MESRQGAQSHRPFLLARSDAHFVARLGVKIAGRLERESIRSGIDLRIIAGSLPGYMGMVNIEVGFEPHPFEKPALKQVKEDIENRLQGHEFGRFKIVLKKAFGTHQIACHFVGNPESCEKAKRLLGLG
jgi:hypothetical protein